MNIEKNRVCPVELAGGLDNRWRRWLQDPRKIVLPFVKEGMTVLDLGCGPGFFSIELARLVGPTGRVIAADLQDGMLQKLQKKINGTELEARVTLHKCEVDKIGVGSEIDFALAFYMVHEIPDQKRFLNEMQTILKSDGQFLIVEPPFHVSKRAFAELLDKARAAGLTPVDRPRVRFNKTVLLKKKDNRSN